MLHTRALTMSYDMRLSYVCYALLDTVRVNIRYVCVDSLGNYLAQGACSTRAPLGGLPAGSPQLNSTNHTLDAHEPHALGTHGNRYPTQTNANMHAVRV